MKKHKLMGIKWYPPSNYHIRGKIAESQFMPCYCYEVTKDGKANPRCKRCGGKGGHTDIWIEPLIIERIT